MDKKVRDGLGLSLNLFHYIINLPSMRKTLKWIIDLFRSLFSPQIKQTEKSFLLDHANSIFEGELDGKDVRIEFRTPNASEVFLHATGQELFRCKKAIEQNPSSPEAQQCKNKIPKLEAELKYYKAQLDLYVIYGQEVSGILFFDGCPCKYIDPSCNWRPFANRKYIMDFKADYFAIRDMKDNFIVKRTQLNDLVKGKRFYSLVELTKKELAEITAAGLIQVTVRGEINGKTIEKTMLVDTRK